MSLQPYTILEPLRRTPLVIDSPHSGRIYPADFEYVCPLPLLRQTEDSFVDELIAGATEAGATIIVAEFPRSYIDVNRAEDDLDPAVIAEPWPSPLSPSDRTLQGLGLVRRLCKSSVPVYSAPVPVSEIQMRIEKFYRPYHEAVRKTIEQRFKEFGICYLVDAHSMPSQSSENRTARRPDFILGDRNGTACDVTFTRRVRDLLQEMGYSVALNDPYKGMEIVHRYGKPKASQHALQLEINRKLYMNEQTLEKHDGFLRLQQNLTSFFQSLTVELNGELDRMAAE